MVSIAASHAEIACSSPTKTVFFFSIFLFLNDVEKSHFHIFIGPKMPSNLCGHYNASILLKKQSFSLISGFPTNCAQPNVVFVEVCEDQKDLLMNMF